MEIAPNIVTFSEKPVTLIQLELFKFNICLFLNIFPLYYISLNGQKNDLSGLYNNSIHYLKWLLIWIITNFALPINYTGKAATQVVSEVTNSIFSLKANFKRQLRWNLRQI